MPLVNREFLVHFDEHALLIVNLLSESHSPLSRIDLFQIPGSPTHSPLNVDPVKPPAVCQWLPDTKLPLVLVSSGHLQGASLDLRGHMMNMRTFFIKTRKPGDTH